jgi:hypothetical protein
MRTWGLVVGGAGVALVGVGSYFGLRAFSEKQTADGECSATVCTQNGLDAINSMKTAEAVSTISMIAGVAALGTGLYLVVAPAHSPTARSGSAAAQGRLRVGPDTGLRGVRMVWTF